MLVVSSLTAACLWQRALKGKHACILKSMAVLDQASSQLGVGRECEEG